MKKKNYTVKTIHVLSGNSLQKAIIPFSEYKTYKYDKKVVHY